VAAVIVRLNDVPGAREGLGEAPVAGSVLGHAVGDVDDALGRGRAVRVGLPLVDEERFSVARLEGKRGGLHGAGSPRA
jgi:hypothetical protein